MAVVPTDAAKRREMFDVLTSHNMDHFAGTLMIPQSKQSTVPPTILNPSGPPPTSTLGHLDKFPTEMLHIILENLDFPALFTFRLINRRARELVASTTQYQRIMLHAPRVIIALSMAGVGESISIDQVHTALCTKACGLCGKTGGLLWMPECMRCCFRCLEQSPRLAPTLPFAAQGGPQPDVPVVGDTALSFRLWKHLVSRERARMAILALHGGEQGMTRYVTAREQRAELVSRGARAEDRAPRANPWSSLVAIDLPYFDAAAGAVRAALPCQGCAMAYRTRHLDVAEEPWNSAAAAELEMARQRLDLIYTEDEFIEHFKECEVAQEFWEAYLHDNYPDVK